MMVVFMGGHSPTGFPAFTCPAVMYLCRAALMDLIQGHGPLEEERPDFFPDKKLMVRSYNTSEFFPLTGYSG